MVEGLIRKITAPFILPTPGININWEHHGDCTNNLQQIIDELSKIKQDMQNDKGIVYDIALTKNGNGFDIWTGKRRKSLISFGKATIPQFTSAMNRNGWTTYGEHKINTGKDIENPIGHHIEYITKDLPKLFEYGDKILLISKYDFGRNYPRNSFMTFVKDGNRVTGAGPQLIKTLS